MKTFSLLLIILFNTSFPLLFAQTESFSIQDYKFPDLKRTTLTGDFDLDSTLDFKLSDEGSNFETKNKALLGLNAGLNYNLMINSRKWQSNYSASTNNGIAWNRNVSIVDSLSKRNSNAHRLNLSVDLRRYFRKNYFIEINPDLSSSFSRNLIEENGGDRLSKGWYSWVDLDLGLGKGRLEFISDVHQAMFTLEDLEKTGQLERQVNAEDIRLVSDKIAALKNVRFFDSRHKRIFQFTQLDSLLTDLGLVTQGDAATTAILYDNWLFAFRPIRYAGGRFSIGMKGSMFWNKSQKITDVEEDFGLRNSVLGAYIEYRYERPKNLYWQHSVVAKAEWNSRRLYNVVLEQAINDYDSGQGLLQYSLSYYPNTRTDFRAGANLSSSFNLSGTTLMPNGKVWDDLNYATTLFFDANYYVSPQFRVNASYNLGYAKRNANPNTPLPEVPSTALDTGAFSHLDIGLDYFFW